MVPESARHPLALLVVVLLFFLIASSTARETYQAWEVDQEIEGLRAQVAELEGKKLQLDQSVRRLSSPEALDKEARLRLGLQKPGERVIVLKLGNSYGMQGRDQVDTAQADGGWFQNPRKWVRYFLHF